MQASKPAAMPRSQEPGTTYGSSPATSTAAKRDLRGMSFDEGERTLQPSMAAPPVQRSPAAAPSVQQPLAADVTDGDAYWAEVAGVDTSSMDERGDTYTGPSGEALIAHGTGGPGVARKVNNARGAVAEVTPKIEQERKEAAQVLADIESARPDLDGQIKVAEARADQASKKAGVPRWATDEFVEAEKLKDKRASLDTKERKAKETYDAANADLEALSSAGTGPGAMNAILARRGSTASTESESETLETDGSGNIGPLKRGAQTPLAATTSESTTNMVNGAAITRNVSGGHRITTRGLEWSETDEQEIVAGESSAKTSSTKTSWAMPLGGGSSESSSKESTDGTNTTKEQSESSTSFTPWDGYNSASSQSKEETKDGETVKTASSSSTQINTKGIEKKSSDSKQVGNDLHKRESAHGVTRGDGNIGLHGESTETKGDVDAQGVLQRGTATTKQGEAHVTMTDKKAGAGASAGGERKTAHGNGTSSKVSGHCDGHVSVEMKPDTDHPGMYFLVVSLHGGGSVGAGVGKESKNKGANVSANVGAHASIDRTWTHVLSEADCEAYRQALAGVGPGGGGAYPEFAVIGTAWKNGWEGDGAANALKALEQDPAFIKAMKEGDSVESKTKVGADGTIGGGVSAGGFGANASIGLNTEKEISTRFTSTSTGTDMEVEVDDKTGGQVGGGVEFEGVSLGGEYGRKNISGRGVKLSVRQGAPHYNEIVDAVKAAKTQDDIDALMKKYPELKAEQSTLTGEETHQQVTVGVLGATATFGDDHGHTKKETVDKDGNVIKTKYSGHEDSTSSVKVGDIELGTKDKNTLDIEIDKDGNVEGDISHSRSESDITGSLMNMTDKKSPAAAITGAPKAEIDETEISDGMFFKTRDFNNIMAEASDPKAWSEHGVKDQGPWKELGKKIRAAGGDKRKVAELLTEFMDSSNESHREMIEFCIRPAGSINGGDAYQFPASIAHLKGDYHKLIDQDPTGPIAALKNTDPQKAKEAAQALYDEVTWLETSITSAHSTGKFTDEGRFGEMVHRIAHRKSQLQSLMGLGERGKDIARYGDLISICANEKKAEEDAYAKMLSNFDGDRETDPYANVATQNQLRQLYPRFNKDFGELEHLGLKWCLPKVNWEKYRPSPERLAKYDKHERPDEKTTDEDNHDEARGREADRQGDQVWQRSAFHQQAKAQVRLDDREKERQAAAAEWRPRVAGAKSAAQQAAGWKNYADSKGQSVSPEALALAGQGFTKMALLNGETDNFAAACGNKDYEPKSVAVHGQKQIARWNEIKDLFDRGHAANRG